MNLTTTEFLNSLPGVPETGTGLSRIRTRTRTGFSVGKEGKKVIALHSSYTEPNTDPVWARCGYGSGTGPVRVLWIRKNVIEYVHEFNLAT